MQAELIAATALYYSEKLYKTEHRWASMCWHHVGDNPYI